MKTVEYFGHELDVPDNATHMAADSDGTVYAFIGKPSLGKGVWWPESGMLDGVNMCFRTDCPELGMRYVNWRESLREIKS